MKVDEVITKKDKISLFCLSLLSVITHLPWFFNFSILTSGDWAYISAERYKDFLQFSPIWITENFGNTSATPHFYFIRFLESLLGPFGDSFILGEKIFFMIPMAILALVGSYLFLRRYFTESLSFVGACVYGFNTVFLFDHAGPLTIGLVYAAAPLGIYVFRKLYENPKSIKLLFISVFLLSTMIMYEPRITLLVVITIIGWMVFNAFVSKNSFLYYIPRLKMLAILGLLTFSIHAFWILPYILSSGSVTFSDFLGRGLFVSFSDIQNALTLYHPFWTGERPATFVSQAIPIFLWLIPILAFLGFAIKKSSVINRDIYYWVLVSLVGIFLVKQVNEPFVGAYPWLFSSLPGFSAFRESSKFYYFIAIGYSVLIPFGLMQLKTLLNRLKPKAMGLYEKLNIVRLIYMTLYLTTLCLFLINAIPLINNSFKTLYVTRTVPSDYRLFNDYINKQGDFFRIMWTPVDSRWVSSTNQHPKLVADKMATGEWFSQVGRIENPDATTRDRIAKIIQHSTAQDVLNKSNVKYVVVPTRDTQSDDDFFKFYGNDRNYYLDLLNNAPYLKKLNLGTKELAVYENKTYQPYIRSVSSLVAIKFNDPLDMQFSFLKNQLGLNFDIVDKTKQQNVHDDLNVRDPFQNLTKENIINNKISVEMDKQDNQTLYSDENATSLYYVIDHNSLSLYSKKGSNLSTSSGLHKTQTESLVSKYVINKDAELYLQYDSSLVRIPNENGRRNIGNVKSNVALYVVKGPNELPNANFIRGMWQDKVNDCNSYDNSNPKISMNLKRLDNVNTLELSSNNHTACTQQENVSITDNAFLLEFDYRLAFAKGRAGYEITFNDAAHTQIKEELSATNTDTQHYRKLIVKPADATTYTLRLLAYPDYRLENNSKTQFSNFSERPLISLMNSEIKPRYEKVNLPNNQKIRFDQPSSNSSSNLIENGSFENGLWQDRVGDCNRYDDNPSIGMKESDIATDGKHSLELNARSHDACTSKDSIKVGEGLNYLLTFKYQSPNAKNLGYYVQFNDPNGTRIEKQIAVSDKKWNLYSTQVQAPFGATKMKIVVYAYGDPYKSKTYTARYDDFSLNQISSLSSQYFLVSTNSSKSIQPRHVEFENIDPAMKRVVIKGATGNFHLAMGESFNSQWKLLVDDQRTNRLLSSMPFGPYIDASNDHYALNDFQNGWYVNVNDICDAKGLCQQNQDGTYDIQLTIEFMPQRWFNLGKIISCVTIITILASYTILRFKHRMPSVSHK